MHPIPSPAFSTQRLHLRPLSEADEALYCQLYTDPEVMRHIAAPLSVEAARRNFHAACRKVANPAGSLQIWVIAEHAVPAAIGILALMRQNVVVDTLEMGTMLLPAGWGRGLASEAQTALLDRVFSAPGLRMVWTCNAPGHAAVIGLKLKLGFRRADADGADPQRMHWQMTRERWLSRCEPCAEVVIAGQNR